MYMSQGNANVLQTAVNLHKLQGKFQLWKVKYYTARGSDGISEGRKTEGDALKRYDLVKETHKHEDRKDTD